MGFLCVCQDKHDNCSKYNEYSSKIDMICRLSGEYFLFYSFDEMLDKK